MTGEDVETWNGGNGNGMNTVRNRLALLFALGTFALSALGLGTVALAQEDADIAPRFRNTISPEEYHKLRDQYLSLRRGLPADPTLRAAAVELQRQQLAAARPVAPNVFSPGSWNSIGPTPIPNGQLTGALAVSGRVTVQRLLLVALLDSP